MNPTQSVRTSLHPRRLLATLQAGWGPLAIGAHRLLSGVGRMICQSSTRAWGCALCLAMVLIVTVAPAAVRGQSRTVQVGVYQNKPKIFTDENGRPAGILIELLDEIAAQEGWTISYVTCEWTECLRALEEGRIDLMPDVAFSPEREVKYDFHSTPVLESWSRIYASSRTPIYRTSELNGRRVAVLSGSIQQAAFEQMMTGFGYRATVVPTASLEEAFALASKGSVDAAIANHLFGDYFYQDYGLLKTTVVFNPTTLYYATAKGRNHDLLDAIDRHLDEWLREPHSTYYSTLSRWGEREPVGSVPQSVLWVLGGIAGLLVLAVGAIVLLRQQVAVRTRHLESASAELKKSEERYRTLARISPVGIFRTDLDGATTYVNPKWREISGLSNEQARGDGWLAAVHPDDRERLGKGWQQSTLRQEAAFSDYRFVRADGTVVWVMGQAVPERDAENRLSGYVGTITDITERKRAEAALQANERQLSLIYANISDVLFVLGVEPGDRFRFISVNSTFVTATGLTEDQIVGRLVEEVIPEPAHALALEKYKEAVRTKKAVAWDEVSVYPAGTKYAEVSVTPILDANGQPTTLLGTVHDVTERKRAEEESRRRADEFASLYETAKEMTSQPSLSALLETITDRTSRLLHAGDAVIYLYDAARNDLELAAANVYGQPRGTRFAMGVGVSSQVVSTRRPLIVDDYRLWNGRRPEFAPTDYRAVAQVPLIYRDEVIGVLGVAQIGTDRKFAPDDTRLMELLASEAAIAIQNVRLLAELEAYSKELEQRVAVRTEELRAAMRQAQEADRLKSAFLATMSHELRTPLNSIIGFTGVLLQGLAGPLNAEQMKQLGMARDSARHLLALINDVLDISKIEAGQLKVATASFDMRAAIEDALRSVTPQAQRKGLSLAAAIGSNVGMVVSDQRRVEQILLNLLSNAVKFTERGEVQLKCRVRDGWLETSVHDTGIGIQPDDLSKLFQPFHQLETGLNRRHEGTGLGLAICKNLVALLGGSISAESEWGAGSTFTFTLPLAPEGETHG
jgi:PAS domain S-box-containing protein